MIRYDDGAVVDDEKKSSPEPTPSPAPPSPAAGAAPSSAEEPASTDSPWRQKMARARHLWEAGNNAELRKLVAELEQAPADEPEARELAQEMRTRLRPDPFAIGLWLLSLAVFVLLTSLFVLR